MALSIRQLLSFAAFAAVVVVADANRVHLKQHGKQQQKQHNGRHAKGEYSSDYCTDAQEVDIVNYAEELYVDDCDVDPCSSTCIDAITALYIAVPDCVDYDEINYTEVTGLWLEECANAASSGSSGYYSTEECTPDQESETDDVFLTYDTGACTEEDSCSDECLTDLDNFYVYLPDCVYSDGLNYLGEIDYWYTDCSTEYSSEDYDDYSDYSDYSDYDDYSKKHKKSSHSPKWRK